MLMLPKVIWIFEPILRQLKKTCFALEQLYMELKVKSLFETISNVLPFNFKFLTAICCIVKLIPWNVVNPSHLYLHQIDAETISCTKWGNWYNIHYLVVKFCFDWGNNAFISLEMWFLYFRNFTKIDFSEKIK